MFNLSYRLYIICTLYLCTLRFTEDEVKSEQKNQQVNGKFTTSIQLPKSDKEIEYDGQSNRSDSEESIEEKFSDGFLANQKRNSKNQLKVENPADFKNSEVNGSAFEKPKTEKDENDLPNPGKGKVSPPVLPSRGILKRAKNANSKNEDKQGV